MTVSVLGNDGRLAACRTWLMRLCPNTQLNVFLFPIPLSVNGSTVNGTEIPLCNIGSLIPTSAVAVIYDPPREARRSLSECGAEIVDLARCESYLEKNAALTAVGTVARIASSERRAPGDISVGIIGYGRIGRHLARIFAFLGARVKIYTSKNEVRRDLCMLGVCGIDSLSLADGGTENAFLGLDVLINTAPVRLLCPNNARELAGVRVIELASGKNMPEGVEFERFSAVPAVMYPESAGRVMAESIIDILGVK